MKVLLVIIIAISTLLLGFIAWIFCKASSRAEADNEQEK